MPSIAPSVLRDLLKFKDFNKNQTASECVNDLGYDPEAEELTVEFQERGTYKYSGVPLEEYTNFQLAGSQGKYFNTYIRNQYPYERVG